MRAELMVKARQRGPSWFGLTDLEFGEDVVSSCQWLLQENHFLYGGINLKVGFLIRVPAQPLTHHKMFSIL